MEEVTVITQLNFNKVCRVCLIEYEEMLSLYSEIQTEESPEEDPLYLCEMLTSISSMKIRLDDGLPNLICANCVELTHASFKFQQQCNRSQDLLEMYAVQLQSKVDEDEPEDILQYVSTEMTTNKKEESLQQESESSVVEENKQIELEVSLEESNSRISSDDEVSVKTEIKDEPTTEKESNFEGKLAETSSEGRIKRLKRSSDKKIGQPAVGFSYNIKMGEDGEKVFECNYCKKIYKQAHSLRSHIRTHTIELPYVCSHCGKGFKQYASLTHHLRSHTGEQPYACKICGKRYRQSGTLTAHMRVHTGQRPFLCSVCGRGFRQAPDLGYHMRTHTKERPYMCNVCGKTMRMQCHLVQHMRIHTGEKPYQCTECTKAFPSSTRLKRHAIIHTGLKPYTCEVCNKSFNRLSSLRVHAKIHANDRPHVCPFCNKGFIQAHALRSHINTHSTVETVEEGVKVIENFEFP